MAGMNQTMQVMARSQTSIGYMVLLVPTSHGGRPGKETRFQLNYAEFAVCF